MTYLKGYVATIRANGQTLPEKNGKIEVPFHTEYTIRLRNKTRKRAVADVYIDGRLINKAGGLVVPANDFVDLERFIDNLTQGQKLRFVPLEDGRVSDKNELDNGRIEIKFYPEKDHTPPITPLVIEKHIHHNHYNEWIAPRRWPECPPYGQVWCSSADNQSLGGSTTYAMNVATTNTGGILRSTEMKLTANATGATVAGGISNQSFGSTYVNVDRSNPVILHIQLVGTGNKKEGLLTAVRDAIERGELEGALDRVGEVEHLAFHSLKGPYCTTCGKKASTAHKFCGHCGVAIS